MRVELAPAFILHRRAWRDTSYLLEAFTREHGRVGLIARGARRARGRWQGLLEPLVALQLSWAGRGELKTLTGIEVTARFELTGNRLWSGFYANELVLRLTAREDPHAAIHDALHGLLQTMAAGAPGVLALRYFERDLLQAIGYGLSLTVTANGQPIRSGRQYIWHAAGGLTEGGAGDDGVAVPGSALLDLAAGTLHQRADIHAVRALLGAAIAPHLGERPLQTLQTLRAMRQFRATPSTSGQSP